VPTANAGSDVTFCSGQSSPIGSAAVSGYNYSWAPTTGISNAATANPTLALTNATTVIDTASIILTVTWFGCPDKDTISAFIKPLPLSDAGANLSLCDGDTVNLGSVTTAGYTYQWNPIAQLNSGTISNPQLIVSNTGTTIDTLQYNVTTTLNGCTSTDSTTVVVNPLPTVQATATPTAICTGNSTTLNGTGAATYSWATTTAPGISIGTGASLLVTPISTTSYIVTGISSASCTNTFTITVTVNQLPTVTSASASDTICNGDTLQLNGNGANTYTWYELGSGTSIGTGSPFSVSPTTGTSYILQGTDANSCENSDTIAIVVSPPATISGITGTVSLCPGVVGVNYWVNNPVGSSNYQWTINNGSLFSGQGNDTALVDWPASGIGSVTVTETTDQGCESQPIVLPVVINTLLTPIAPAGLQTLCGNQANGIVYTTLQTAGSNYTWHASGGTIVSPNPDVTGTVTIDWNLTGPATGYVWYEENDTTASSICSGVSDSIAITINPFPVTSAIQGVSAICMMDTASYSVVNNTGNTYVWAATNGTIISGSATNAISVVWNSSGSYSVTVTETNSFNCTGALVFQNVIVNALPNANAGLDTGFCAGTNVALLASGGTTYSWTPATGLNNAGINNPVANPIATTTYTVLVTDANGCKKTDAILVTVNDLPIADAGTTTAVCLNSATVLNASGGTNYAWSPATGLNNTGVANPSANPTITTLYSVVVTDNNNCSAMDTVTVFVNTLPMATVVEDSLLTCDGSAVTLTANGGSQYVWSPSTNLSNPNASSTSANPTSPVTYAVEVTDVNGCKDTATVFVDVNAQPNASFEVDSILSKGVTCNGVEVVFKNTSTNAVTYHWDFGDGGSSTEQDPSHLYAFSQNGAIELIAYNNQCSDTAYLPNPVLSLSNYLENQPNVFTPNGDGKNDCFRLGKDDAFDDCSEMKIFNRWGKLVFETDATYKCWNGKNKSTGTEEPTGVYFYILIVGDFQLKGTVSLVQ